MYEASMASAELAPGSPPMPEHQPSVGSIEDFLGFDLLVRGSEAVTTKQLLGHYANRQGGVHHDNRPAQVPLLADVLNMSERAANQTVLAATRILYSALEPVAVDAFLRMATHPYGLSGRGPLRVVEEDEGSTR